ncbi:MAG: carboxypeptidase-like regulatory domain-containing protein [Hymenobacter sp.]
MKKLYSAFTLLALALPAVPALAQGTTNEAVRMSALGGTVHTEQGGPLAGATLVALHLPSGIRRTITTDQQGSFSLEGLIPGGPYIVQLVLSGYRAQVLNNLFLKAGQPTSLVFRLVPATVAVGYAPHRPHHAGIGGGGGRGRHARADPDRAPNRRDAAADLRSALLQLDPPEPDRRGRPRGCQ